MSIYWLNVKVVRPFIYFIYICRRRLIVHIRKVENQNDSKNLKNIFYQNYTMIGTNYIYIYIKCNVTHDFKKPGMQF